MTVAKRAMKRDKSRKSNLHYMFMDDEKVGKTRALLVARERETRAVLSTVCPRMSTLWPHHDVGQRASIDEFDLEDSESKKSCSRMIIENSLVGSSQSKRGRESDSICASHPGRAATVRSGM